MPPQAAAASTVINRRGSILDQDTRSVFDRIDEDASGNIDKRELRKGLREMGIRNVTPEQLDMFYQKYARSSPAGMTYDEFDALMQTVKKHLKSLGLEVHPQVLPGQDWVREVYNMPRCMYSVAALIVISFGCNILEKEIDPSGEQYKSVWEGLDTTFNILFLFELLVNMYGYGGPRPAFWRSAWNVFDTIVVAVGCVLMTGAELGAFNKLKLMRAFRVFRLFKRIESLNQIITAIVRCIPGVLNAGVIMLIVFCIYAILAVDLFREFGDGGQYETTPGGNVSLVSSVTARGFSNGDEYYGTFSRALYTLFQVMTGESWSEAVARPLIFGLHRDNAFVASAFFVSFILVMQFVLINVVVAVLLDKFMTKPEDPMMSADDLLGKPDGNATPVRPASPVAGMAPAEEVPGAGVGIAGPASPAPVVPSIVTGAVPASSSTHALSEAQQLPSGMAADFKVLKSAASSSAASASASEAKLDMLLKAMAELQRQMAELRQERSAGGGAPAAPAGAPSHATAPSAPHPLAYSPSAFSA